MNIILARLFPKSIAARRSFRSGRDDIKKNAEGLAGSSWCLSTTRETRVALTVTSRLLRQPSQQPRRDRLSRKTRSGRGFEKHLAARRPFASLRATARARLAAAPRRSFGMTLRMTSKNLTGKEERKICENLDIHRFAETLRSAQGDRHAEAACSLTLVSPSSRGERVKDRGQI